MKVIIACDSFKDALSAPEVCRAVHEGIVDSGIDLKVIELPMADGGEGTAAILKELTQGRSVPVRVMDPLFRERETELNYSSDGKMAFIDMAQVSGLFLLRADERNPWHTTTYGTGQLIREAVERGTEKIIMGIGGSATNDAGMGMASALGYRFFDAHGKMLQGTGRDMGKVTRIRSSEYWTKNSIPIEVLCDVQNPLYGEYGAAFIFASQKGADDALIERLDKGLRHFAMICKTHFQSDCAGDAGSGAAGGLGYGLKTFLGASLKPGTEMIFSLSGLDKELVDTDLVITGEGRIDGQTQYGKLIKGVCERASLKRIPVIALCGLLDADQDQINKIGLMAAYTINDQMTDLQTALKNTRSNLRSKTAEVVLHFFREQNR